MRWHDKLFDDLTPRELYAILALRCRVFVVEQACPYQDIDGHDPSSRHMWAEAPGGAIHAYLRVVPAGEKFAEASLGRVVVLPEARGTGLGRDLMQRGLAAIGQAPVRIWAQAYLARFYAELGFVEIGEPFDDDGIQHIEMLRA